MEVENHIPTSSAASAKRKLSINDLDDDSLGIIFNKLPCLDRVRIENVCKRWREVSDNNWCCYSKCLIIDDKMGDFPCQQANRYESSGNLLEERLRRQGPYIEEVDFKINSSSTFGPGTIERIAWFCPKLKRLHVGSLNMSHEDWRAIGSNLEALSFSCSTDRYGYDLGHLLRRTKRLRRIQIESDYFLKPSAFNHLDPGQLEFLKVSGCKQFVLTDGIADKLTESLVELFYHPSRNDTCYLRNLHKLKNLRSLNLKVPWHEFETTLIADLTKNCRKLECVILDFPQDPCNETHIAPLFGLPCLRRLNISIAKMEAISLRRLTTLFRKAPNLELFIMNTSLQNIHLTNVHNL